jgi:hypothetical protein
MWAKTNANFPESLAEQNAVKVLSAGKKAVVMLLGVP